MAVINLTLAGGLKRAQHCDFLRVSFVCTEDLRPHNSYVIYATPDKITFVHLCIPVMTLLKRYVKSKSALLLNHQCNSEL